MLKSCSGAVSEVNFQHCFLCDTEDEGKLHVATECGLASVLSGLAWMRTNVPNLIPEMVAEKEFSISMLLEKGAKYHAKCRNRFSDARVKTLSKKRKISDQGSPNSKRPCLNLDCPIHERMTASSCGSDPTYLDGNVTPDLPMMPIREVILSFASENFRGSLNSNHDAPEEVRKLVSTLVHGKEDFMNNPEVHAISGMITSNSRVIQGERKTRIRRRSAEKETTLFRYISLWLYGQIKSRKVFDFLYKYGMVVSYDRVRRILNSLVYQDIDHFKNVGAFAPWCLYPKVFVTVAFDNVDKGVTSTIGDDWHGTSMSYIQQLKSSDSAERRERPPLVTPPSGFQYSLPDEIKPSSLKVHIPEELFYKSSVNLSDSDICKYNRQNVNNSHILEWLIEIHQNYLSVDVNVTVVNTPVSYIVHSSKKVSPVELPRFVSAIGPVYQEAPNTPEMARFAMDQAIKTTQTLNPGQIAVLTCDQPLYILCKKLQLIQDQQLSMSKIFLLMGQFHVEKELLTVHGNVIEGTGLSSVLDSAGLSLKAVGSCLVNVSFVTRTRYILQATTIALHSMLQDAFDQDGAEDRESWIKEKSAGNSNFNFWCFVMELQRLILLYVKSIRERNLELNLAILDSCCKYFFALDKTNYARATPMHLADFAVIKKEHPELYERLKEDFAVCKTNAKYSAMATDQCHEQNNALIKEMRGGLAFLGRDKEESLIKWSLYAPTLAAILTDDHSSTSTEHHEDYGKFQQELLDNSVKVKAAMMQTFNPFKTVKKELCLLNNGCPMPNNNLVHESMSKLKAVGQLKYEQFVSERLVSRKIPITAKIPRNLLTIPSRAEVVIVKDAKMNQNAEQKLIRNLKHAAHYRPAEVRAALAYEIDNKPRVFINHSEEFNAGKKSSLLPRLKTLGQCTRQTSEGLIFDLSALVHQVCPKASGKPLSEFPSLICSSIEAISNSHKSSAVCVVSDRYDLKNHMKQSSASNSSKSSQVRLSPDFVLPPKMQSDFLRNLQNKDQLYTYLCPQIYEILKTKFRIVRVTNKSATLGGTMAPSNHLEADYKMVLYVEELLRLGITDITIRTGDTDVVVIMTGHAPRLLQRYPALQIKISFVTAGRVTPIDVLKVSSAIGQDHCLGFMLLYAYTGCDYTPHFSFHGKSSWMDLFLKNEQFKDLLQSICANPKDLSNGKLVSVANYTLHLYSIPDPSIGLLEARLQVLKRPSTDSFRSLPPSPGAALIQLRKAIFVASEIWKKANEPNLNYSEMISWGWKTGGNQIWTAVPSVSNEVFENCYKKCSKNCKCTSCNCKIKFEYACLPECGCAGGCS